MACAYKTSAPNSTICRCMFVLGGGSLYYQAILHNRLGVLQFNSILTLYPEIATDSTGCGLGPTRLPSTSDVSFKSRLLPVLLTDYISGDLFFRTMAENRLL